MERGNEKIGFSGLMDTKASTDSLLRVTVVASFGVDTDYSAAGWAGPSFFFVF